MRRSNMTNIGQTGSGALGRDIHRRPAHIACDQQGDGCYPPQTLPGAATIQCLNTREMDVSLVARSGGARRGAKSADRSDLRRSSLIEIWPGRATGAGALGGSVAARRS